MEAPELAALNPRVRYLWWAQGAVTAAQVGVAALLVEALTPLPTPTGLVGGTLFALAVLAAVVGPPLRYRRWRYAVRDEDLWIRQGVLRVTTSVIPFSRLQFVDTRQGPLDRLFRLSQLVVHTAALGTSGRLPGLDAAQAEVLRERLAHVEPDVDSV